MKSVNDGGSFEAVFEKEPVASIGAVAVAPSDPKTVWVGTGEANDRNSSGWGDGVYRSTDGGATWTNVGLATSKAIARIVVHPTDPKTAYVCAAGKPLAARGRAGPLQDDRRRDDVEEGPLGRGARRREDRLRRRRPRPLEPRNASTRCSTRGSGLPGPSSPAPTLTGGRDVGGIFRSDGRRRDVEEADERPPGADAADRPRRLPEEPEDRLSPSSRPTKGGRATIRDIEEQAGRRLPVGGRRRDVDADEPARPAAVLLQPDPRRPGERQARLRPRLRPLTSPTTAGQTFREDLFDKVHPTHELVVAGRPHCAIDPKEGSRRRKPVSPRSSSGPTAALYMSLEAGENWDHLDRFAAGRVLPDLPRRLRPVPDLRRPSGQPELGRPEPHAARRTASSTPTGSNLGGGDGFYDVFDPDGPRRRLRRVAGGVRSTASTSGSGQVKRLRPEPAEGQPAFRFHWCSPLRREPPREGRRCSSRGTASSALTEKGEEWTPDQPRPLRAGLPRRSSRRGSGAENYGVVYALAESPREGGPPLGRDRRRKALGDGGRRRRSGPT